MAVIGNKWLTWICAFNPVCMSPLATGVEELFLELSKNMLARAIETGKDSESTSQRKNGGRSLQITDDSTETQRKSSCCGGASSGA